MRRGVMVFFLTLVFLATVAHGPAGAKSYRISDVDIDITVRADGSFEFTGLADVAHSVYAWCEGYRLDTPGVDRYRVAPGSTVDFVATPSIMNSPSARDMRRMAALRVSACTISLAIMLS